MFGCIVKLDFFKMLLSSSYLIIYFLLNTEGRVFNFEQTAGVGFLILCVNMYIHFSVKILYYPRIELGVYSRNKVVKWVGGSCS